MTDEELQAIRERWFISGEQGPELLREVSPSDQARDMAALLDEVQRLDIELFDWDNRLRALEAENARMREIVAAVADMSATFPAQAYLWRQKALALLSEVKE